MPFNLKIYPLEAILNACYIFADKAYFYLDFEGKRSNYLSVFLRLKNKNVKSLSFKGDFLGEVIQQTIRYLVSKRNKKIREYIVGKALYATWPATDDQLGDSNKETVLGYKKDLMQIATPWEEKHKSNASKNRKF